MRPTQSSEASRFVNPYVYSRTRNGLEQDQSENLRSTQSTHNVSQRVPSETRTMGGMNSLREK
jgi:hypothetical protein